VKQKTKRSKALLPLVIGSLGVVFGDIGTSPLYAVNEIFFGHGMEDYSASYVTGIISLLIWCLTIIVAFKYVIFILRADSEGEGGVFALLSLVLKYAKKKSKYFVLLLLFAAGLLYGDGIITPAISVLSAVEGLKIVTISMEPFIIPLTLVILSGLFIMQRFGTGKVGKIFGPIIIVWFIAIGILGFNQLIQHPQILWALNPLSALAAITKLKLHQFMLIMGSVMLVVTGGEAMYADMGHFGKRPIKISWFCLVFPALLLNYLGQGAYLLSGQEIFFGNVFFSLVPAWAMIPMVLLATMATVIASQALISGAFSLTAQAINLGYFPLLKIVHTSKEHAGQIFVPAVNLMLYLGCILLILSFRSSTNLAAAYGLAVSGNMVITSITMIIISQRAWKWSLFRGLALFIPLICLEMLFVSSNLLKLVKGGWIPLTIAMIIVLVMRIWKMGKDVEAKTHKRLSTISMGDFLRIHQAQKTSLAHSSVFITPLPVRSLTDKVPPILEIFWNRYGVLPKNIILLFVKISNEPYVENSARYEVFPMIDEKSKGYVAGVNVKFGFMEDPNVERILHKLAAHQEIKIEEDHEKWLIHVINSKFLFSRRTNFFKKILYRIYRFIWNNTDTMDSYLGLGDHLELTVETVPIRLY